MVSTCGPPLPVQVHAERQQPQHFQHILPPQQQQQQQQQASGWDGWEAAAAETTTWDAPSTSNVQPDKQQAQRQQQKTQPRKQQQKVQPQSLGWDGWRASAPAEPAGWDNTGSHIQPQESHKVQPIQMQQQQQQQQQQDPWEVAAAECPSWCSTQNAKPQVQEQPQEQHPSSGWDKWEAAAAEVNPTAYTYSAQPQQQSQQQQQQQPPTRPHSQQNRQQASSSPSVPPPAPPSRFLNAQLPVGAPAATRAPAPVPSAPYKPIFTTSVAKPVNRPAPPPPAPGHPPPPVSAVPWAVPTNPELYTSTSHANTQVGLVEV